MDIVHHISELIYDHDCVIVPELGGFVSNYQSATIHPVQHQFHPPSKNILFNEALKSNDGLLANHIAAQHKIPYEAAMEKLREFVSIVKQSLSIGDIVELKNIGRFIPDRSGVIHFQQGKVNYLKDVYGMSSFVSPAIRRESKRPVKVIRPAIGEEQKHHRQNQAFTLVFRIAASLAILVMLSIAGFNIFRDMPVDTHESGLHTSITELVNHPMANDENDVDPLTIPEIEIPDETNAAKGKDDAADDPTSPGRITIDPEADKPNVKPEPVKKPNEKMPAENDGAAEIYQEKYHLIAGSFLDKKNAGTLIGKYAEQGFEPTTIGPSSNGYFRVSIAAYLRKNDALTELHKVRQAFDPSIWLLRH